MGTSKRGKAPSSLSVLKWETMKLLLALGLLAFLTIASGAQESNGVWTTKDSWYNPPPQSLTFDPENETGRGDYG